MVLWWKVDVHTSYKCYYFFGLRTFKNYVLFLSTFKDQPSDGMNFFIFNNTESL